MNKIISYAYCELEMADKYIDCAVAHDGEEKELYKSLAKDELSHAEKLVNLGNAKAKSLDEHDKHYIIWEYEKENILSKWMRIKSEWAMI